MKKIITTVAISIAAAATFYMSAEDKMIVNLKDGTTQEFDVNKIDKVSFEYIEPAFTVTLPGEDMVEYTAIPTLLRQTGATGEATQFGFGNVTAETPAELTAGEYGVYFSLSPSKVYNGTVDLATESSSYVLKLVKYVEGASEFILDKVTSGSITTSINSKTQKVTLDINAEFDDGTVITAKYEGSVKNVTSIEEMLPGKSYGNEVFGYSNEGVESHATITGFSASKSDYTGDTTLKFKMDSYIGTANEIRIVMTEDLINSNAGTFDMATTIGWQFRCGGVQLYNVPDSDPSKPYKNIADNGTMKVIVNDDGTYEVFVDVQNYYDNSFGTHQGDGYRVILNYVGAPF